MPYTPFASELLGPLGLTAGLIILVIAKIQGYWYWRGEMRKERRRGNFYKQRGDRLEIEHLKLLGATEAMLTLVESGHRRPEELAEEIP